MTTWSGVRGGLVELVSIGAPGPDVALSLQGH